jgi:hypothetical protein
MLALVLLAGGCGDDAPSRMPLPDGGFVLLPDGALSDGPLADGAPADGSPPAADGSLIRPDGGDAALQLADAGLDGSLIGLPDGAVPAPPSAGFQLSSSVGAAPVFVQAISSARSFDGQPAQLSYDWGEGGGFVAAASHRYLRGGTFNVRQKVRDVFGQEATTSNTVTIEDFTPVRFSRSDRSPYVFVSPDGYEVENKSGPGGVRTDASIAPGSGVFYFETVRLSELRVGGFGVATVAHPLDEGGGSDPQSLGLAAWGPVEHADGTCVGEEKHDTSQREVGFVVDYRAASPTIHLIQRGSGGTPTVRTSCTMTVSAPLFGFYWSERARVGNEGRINTGADTVNAPFTFGEAAVRAALTAAGKADAASALVMGFGKTRAGRLDAAPTLVVPNALQVALNQPVTLEGSALDTEDGELSAQIAWVDLATQFHARVGAVGKTFTFTPNSIGKHPVEATVTDLDGVKTSKTVMVTVIGELPRPNPVQLAPDPLSGEGITLTPDALSVRFAGPGKDGIRANQGIYGQFWYFEVHRNNPIRNMGMGLIIQDGALNPYHFEDVPWSCSINTWRGVWKHLIFAAEYSGIETDTDYGFAVDYRGDHPTVYVIVRGALQATVVLEDVWVPIYPMVYGNIAESPLAPMDMTINFGATPFAIDARTVLTAAGVDASALRLGWGVHAP